jgi:oligopeptide transport system permease protein
MNSETKPIDKDLFIPASDAEKALIDIMRPSTTYWKDAWKSLKSNKLALASLVVILLIALAAIIGPMISHYTYDTISKTETYQFPSWTHPFGTDNLGRDLFVRNMYGARISLLIGVISSVIVVIIGIIYGAVSGYFGGWVDSLMMRIVDVIYAIPTTLFAILLKVIIDERLKGLGTNSSLGIFSQYGSGFIGIIVVLAALFWVDMARIVRGQVLQLKQQEFVLAAKALGGKHSRIIGKHLIPNSIGPIIVTAAYKIPQAIFLESFLSFISLGVSSPMASLGTLTDNGLNGISSYPYMILFPALLISIIILSFNLLGDGLRDALDPRVRNKESK